MPCNRTEIAVKDVSDGVLVDVSEDSLVVV
jgi:hypothetical protein